MSVLEIQTRNDLGAWNQQTDLEQTTFGFQFRWNDRDQAYYFNILNESGDVIRAGVRVIVNFELLRQLVDEGRPLGKFLAWDPRSDPQPPVFGEIGDAVILTYTESTTPGL